MLGKRKRITAVMGEMTHEVTVRCRYPHCRLAAGLTDYGNANRRTVYRVERVGDVPYHRKGLGPWRETPEGAWQGAAARIKVDGDRRAAARARRSG